MEELKIPKLRILFRVAMGETLAMDFARVTLAAAFFASRAFSDPRPVPFDYASVTEGSVAANGTAAFLVSGGVVGQQLFVAKPNGILVHLEVNDKVAKLSFDQLHGLTVADDGSLLLVMAVVPGEGQFPVRCNLSKKPVCHLVRIDGVAARDARLLEGGRTMLAISSQEDGEFKPLGAVLIDTASGKLTKVAAGLYVEGVLWASGSTALLKVADVRRGQPTFGVARLRVREGRPPELRRGFR